MLIYFIAILNSTSTMQRLMYYNFNIVFVTWCFVFWFVTYSCSCFVFFFFFSFLMFSFVFVVMKLFFVFVFYVCLAYLYMTGILITHFCFGWEDILLKWCVVVNCFVFHYPLYVQCITSNDDYEGTK